MSYYVAFNSSEDKICKALCRYVVHIYSEEKKMKAKVQKKKPVRIQAV
jgi:hypothetical protein